MALAGEYLQRVRETGDAAFYARAETLLRGVLARDPDNADALVALGGLALSRHDFRGGLALARRADAGLVGAAGRGRRARRARPLRRGASGRCSDSANLKPNLSTYARVSYLRELHGDLRGAARALALASAAGGPAPENAAAIDVLRGDLALVRARPDEARAAYARALADRAEVRAGGGGRARLAAHRPARGSPSGATARSSRGCRCPSTSSRSARRSSPPGGRAPRGEDFALVRVQQRLLARAGVNTDVELAVFESDHGSRARGLRARAARVGGGAERALRRRARLGADAQRPALTRGCAGRGARGGSGRPTRCSRSTRA